MFTRSFNFRVSSRGAGPDLVGRPPLDLLHFPLLAVGLRGVPKGCGLRSERLPIHSLSPHGLLDTPHALFLPRLYGLHLRSGRCGGQSEHGQGHLWRPRDLRRNHRGGVAACIPRLLVPARTSLACVPPSAERDPFNALPIVNSSYRPQAPHPFTCFTPCHLLPTSPSHPRIAGRRGRHQELHE